VMSSNGSNGSKNRVHDIDDGQVAVETKQPKKSKARGEESVERITITAPNLKTVTFHICGTSPLVQNKFGNKAREIMRAAQEQGSIAKKGKKKEPKDFEALFHESYHKGIDGSYGFPAAGLRSAMISACRSVGFKMTHGKQFVFVEADTFDVDGTALVKITKGEPRHVEHPVRIQTTTDIRVRAMWDPGWEALPRLTFDADQFTTTDVANLLMRVGLQVGIGEGRHDSRSSAGCGWGCFKILGL